MSACLSQIRKYDAMYTKWSLCSSDTVVVIHINNRLALIEFKVSPDQAYYIDAP